MSNSKRKRDEEDEASKNGPADRDSDLELCGQYLEDCLDEDGNERDIGEDTQFYLDLCTRSQILPHSIFRKCSFRGANNVSLQEEEGVSGIQDKEKQGKVSLNLGRNNNEEEGNGGNENEDVSQQELDISQNKNKEEDNGRNEKEEDADVSLPINPHEDSFLMPLSRSKEMCVYGNVPRCCGDDGPTPQDSFTSASPCCWPEDIYKYTTSPKSATFPPGGKLAARSRSCCNKLHYDDIKLTLNYGNKVEVPVLFTHAAITRLLRIEAEEYFSVEKGSQRHALFIGRKHAAFRAVEEGPNPTFLCQSVDDNLRVSGVSFSYTKS